MKEGKAVGRDAAALPVEGRDTVPPVLDDVRREARRVGDRVDLEPGRDRQPEPGQRLATLVRREHREERERSRCDRARRELDVRGGNRREGEEGEDDEPRTSRVVTHGLHRKSVAPQWPRRKSARGCDAAPAGGVARIVHRGARRASRGRPTTGSRRRRSCR